MLSHHSHSHQLLAEIAGNLDRTGRPIRVSKPAAFDPTRYKCYVGHYEQADCLIVGFYLTGPGLEPYYTDGKAQIAYANVGGIDERDDTMQLDMSGALGAEETDTDTFEEQIGSSIMLAVRYIMAQKSPQYPINDLGESD